MSGLVWNLDAEQRFAAIRADLAQVSTASACQLLLSIGWRNTYMLGLLPLQPLGLGQRVVGRARTCRFLPCRGPEGPHDPAARRVSPEIVLIESLEPHDIICIDALGLPTVGIIGDILSARILALGAAAAIVHGAVRDAPFINGLGLPVFCASVHPSNSGRDLMPVDYDLPVDMGGVQVIPGDIILADDEGALVMPLELAEWIAAHGPEKELLESWIREKVAAGGSIHDYYPPLPEKFAEYTAETGRPAPDLEPKRDHA